MTVATTEKLASVLDTLNNLPAEELETVLIESLTLLNTWRQVRVMHLTIDKFDEKEKRRFYGELK